MIMKKLLLILAVCAMAVTATSCKTETPDPNIQDHTSFIFHNHRVGGTTFSNMSECKAGYFNTDGYCIEIADFSPLMGGETTDEITVNDDVKVVFLFTISYHPLTGVPQGLRSDIGFKVKKNYKNNFYWPEKGIVGFSDADINDPKQFPH